jgi:hypothetical protein
METVGDMDASPKLPTGTSMGALEEPTSPLPNENDVDGQMIGTGAPRLGAIFTRIGAERETGAFGFKADGVVTNEEAVNT